MRKSWTFLPLGLCLACLGSGCASLDLPKPEAGFHRPLRYRSAGAIGAPLRARQRLYASYKATVNALGFQVGLSPMDDLDFAGHLEASGAPDLAAGLHASVAEAAAAGGASDIAQVGAGLFSLMPLVSAGLDWSALSGELWAKKKYLGGKESAAERYNARLLQALSLPTDQASLSPERGLPGPLDAGLLFSGVNASLDDFVWDRSVFWTSPPLPWDQTMSRVHTPPQYMVGGQPVEGHSRLEAYLRSQDSDDFAAAYSSGASMETAGAVVEIAGGAMALFGFFDGIYVLFTPNTPDRALPAVFLAGGLVALPTGLVLTIEGRSKSQDAVAGFDLALPGRLRLHLGLPSSQAQGTYAPLPTGLSGTGF